MEAVSHNVARRKIKTPERKAAPVFFVSDRRLDAAVVDGFRRWTFLKLKRRPAGSRQRIQKQRIPPVH
jgi:hypothetical protein